MAAYVAGLIPDLVKGLMLEEPPFFNVMPGKALKGRTNRYEKAEK